MAYVTLSYYKDTYKGTSYSDPDTTKWLERASDDIDMATGYGITEAALTLFELALVQKATCAQAEELITGGDTQELSSASIGKFSYSGAQTTRKPGTLGSRAHGYLAQSGFLFAGIATAGSAYRD